MHKPGVLLLLLVLFTGCNQNESPKPVTTSASDSLSQSAAPNKDSSRRPDTDHLIARDTLLLNISKQILTVIKNRDLNKLASYVHPQKGVRFAPYAYIDTVRSKRFSPAQLIEYGKKSTRFTWGTTDGEGKPIVLSINGYFDRYVYDKDFLSAKEISVNKFLGGGNSLNNLKEIYAGSDFTEFYFPGFDPKYEGMDWRTLRLVFKTENNQPWLIAIVHDEWTI